MSAPFGTFRTEVYDELNQREVRFSYHNSPRARDCDRDAVKICVGETEIEMSPEAFCVLARTVTTR